MNGKKAKLVRKFLGYKKSPDHLIERGGIREKDGRLVFQFARNPEANRYRWWKKLVLGRANPPQHQLTPRPQSSQDGQHNGEQNG